MPNLRRLLPLLLLFAAACAPAATDAPVSTLTLIAATATQIPTAVPPTSTPSNLINPEDVNAPTATIAATESLAELTGADLIAADPVAAELVGIAQRLVQEESDLPTSRIRLLDARVVVWTDSALNCPLPESEVVQQDTDGYRIVLGAGEQEYIFHTDVDRVVPCDAANEQLPAGLLPTEEPTSDAAPDVTPEATDSA